MMTVAAIIFFVGIGFLVAGASGHWLGNAPFRDGESSPYQRGDLFTARWGFRIGISCLFAAAVFGLVGGVLALVT